MSDVAKCRCGNDLLDYESERRSGKCMECLHLLTTHGPGPKWDHFYSHERATVDGEESE